MFEPHKNANASAWQGSVKILSFQLAALFVLFAAGVLYVGWSSKAAQAQFMREIASTATEPLSQASDKAHGGSNKHHCSGTAGLVRTRDAAGEPRAVSAIPIASIAQPTVR
jgi:hypothetical protein